MIQEQQFIENFNGTSFYMSPLIAPLSIRKYSAGINTTNDVFQIQDGVFFIMSRLVSTDDNKNKVYFVKDNGQAGWRVSSINIDSGEIDNFIIDGGEW